MVDSLPPASTTVILARATLEALGVVAFVASVFVLCFLAEPQPQASSFALQPRVAHHDHAADPIGALILRGRL